MTRDQAVKHIRDSQWYSYGDELVSLLRLSLRLKTSPPDLGRSATHSHFGGSPAVPSGFQWPAVNCEKQILKQIELMERLTRMPDHKLAKRYSDKIKALQKSLEDPVRPLDFLAALDFADLNAGPEKVKLFPNCGRLLFFYQQAYGGWGFDPADRDFFRVVWVEGSQSVGPPSTVSTIFKHCDVGPEVEWTLPDRPASYGADEDAFSTEDFREFVGSFIFESDSIHRVGGYPQLVQGDMELECQLVTNGIYCGTGEGYRDPRRKILEAGAKDWRLLLQLDSDENPGWMWGDVGRLYFWIRVQDLLELNFDGVWCVQQCH